MQQDLFSTPKKSVTLAVVQSLKEANQDFEFYPTTNSQINVITNDIEEILKSHSFPYRQRDSIQVLDIGAGDGRVLTALGKSLDKESSRLTASLFAVEKATVHTDQYREKDITLIGTEFNEINFISKSTDIAFCNPPYSEYSTWLHVLLTQLNFKLFYAIVPKRWKDDPQVSRAIEQRGITTSKVLASSDFHSADRQARAEVEIVRFAFNDFEAEKDKYEKRLSSIESRRHFSHYQPEIGRNASCPFQIFLETELGLKKSYSQTTQDFHEFSEKERVRKSMQTEGNKTYDLVKSRGVLWALLDNYDRDLHKVLAEYKKISELDPALLQELGVEYDSIRKGVKAKLFGYRNVYWALLFDELETLSSRLTAKNRQSLLNTLNGNSLDFTYTNAVYIIKYAVDMANELIEDSLISVYKTLTSEKSILRHYKSNTHMFNDSWRHTHDSMNDQAKYLLDYRFVSSHRSNFGSNSWDKGLTEDARRYTNDLVVVFKLLGYSDITLDHQYEHMDAGDKLMITGVDLEGDTIELLKIRYYKNGNRHLTFNQKAMLRFNVTVSRLLGWVRNKSEFEAEIDSKKPIADEIWSIGDNLKVQPSTMLALTDKMAA